MATIHRSLRIAGPVLALVLISMVAWSWAEERRAFEHRSWRIGWGDLPPLVAKGGDGGPTGLVGELIRDAAARRKIDLRWVMVKGDPEVALLNGDIDIWPILTVTPERQRRLYFTGRLLEIGHVLLVRKQGPFRQLKDLERARIGLAAPKLDTPRIHELLPGASVRPLFTVTQLVDDLCAGESDAAYMNEYTALGVLTGGVTCGGFHWISTMEKPSQLAIVGTPAAQPAAQALYDEIAAAALEHRLTPAVAEWGYLSTNLESMTRILVERRRSQRLAAAAVSFAALLTGVVVLAVRIRGERNRTRRAEMELRRSGHRSRLVASQLHEGLATLDMDRRWLFVNEAFQAATGADPNSHAGNGAFPWIHADSATRSKERFAAAFEGRAAHDEELRFLYPGGRDAWLLVNWGPIVDDTGEQVGVTVTTRDITAKKVADEALSRTSLRLATLLYNSPLALVEWTEDRRIASWLGGAEAMFGWTADEVVGRRPADFGFVHPEDRSAVEAAVHPLHLGQPTVCQTRNVRRDGSVIHCEWRNSVAPPGSGLRPLRFSLGLDITDRYEVESARRASEKEFRDIFEGAPVGIFRSTLEGRFLRVNPRLAALFGYGSPREMVESVLDIPAQVFVDASRRRQLVARAEQSTGFVNDEVEFRHVNGGTFVGTIYVRLERDSTGATRFLEGFIEDVTKRRMAEDALRRAHGELERRVEERTLELSAANERLRELDRLKSQFLASMSHELRTPLNSIIGFAGLLRKELTGPLNQEQKKQMDIIARSSRHLLSLINDLLDVSRIEAGRADLHFEDFDFQDVVAEVVQSLTPQVNAKKLSLLVDIPAGGVAMHHDRKRTLQVLLNLVNNAVKFTVAGHIRVSARRAGPNLAVTVSDTGIGIKPEHVGMLFEAFRQVDGSARRVYEGAGLGLYLCRKLLSLMGGGIRVESVFGQGATFEFEVPIDSGAAACASSATAGVSSI